MKTIWKNQLQFAPVQAVGLPVGAEIINVADQHGQLCIWSIVNTDAPLKARTIEIIGTGDRINEGPLIQRRFLGTVLTGQYVWHIFERAEL